MATYEAVQTPSISAGTIPDLSELSLGKPEDLYAYSYYAVEFIVKEYGYDKLVALLKSQNDFEGVLGLSVQDFEAKWKDYVRANYK